MVETLLLLLAKVHVEAIFPALDLKIKVLLMKAATVAFYGCFLRQLLARASETKCMVFHTEVCEVLDFGCLPGFSRHYNGDGACI